MDPSRLSMIVHRFLKWCETAGSTQRAAGFAFLARSTLDRHVPPGEIRAAEDALHLAVDDPSPKVRRAVAEAVGTHRAAPRLLVKAFLFDAEEIALRVVASPVLRDDDLIDALPVSGAALQAAVALRTPLSHRVASAVANHACVHACEALLGNASVFLDADILRRLADRHGADPILRSVLLSREDLPADVRQTLILEVGRSLQSAFLVRETLGSERTRRLVLDACERATSKMAEWVETDDVPDLVEHLRGSGQISAAFLVRSACAGNIDLLAASLTALSGIAERRVRSIVVDGRECSFRSLLRSCGLPDAVSTLLRIAVRSWKDVATGRIGLGSEDLPELVMRRVVESFRAQGSDAGHEATMALLRRLESEALHDGMRFRTYRMLAA